MRRKEDIFQHTLSLDDITNFLHGCNGRRMSAQLLKCLPNLGIIHHHFRYVGRARGGQTRACRVNLARGNAQKGPCNQSSCCKHDGGGGDDIEADS